MTKYRDLTPLELEAIQAYAAEHGRLWRRKLNIDWMYARTGGTLQNVRNTLGPSWLADYKLPVEPAHGAVQNAERVALGVRS